MSEITPPHDDLQSTELQHSKVQIEREKFEQQQMTRRAALRRIGVTTGVAAFGLVSIDDLARFAAERLKDHKLTRAMGNSLAEDFKNAGVSFAQVRTDCAEGCEDAFIECRAFCGPVPWGCNPGGGSLGPQCWIYNACLIGCGFTRTQCVIDCEAGGE